MSLMNEKYLMVELRRRFVLYSSKWIHVVNKMAINLR